MRGVQFLLAMAVLLGQLLPASAQDNWHAHYTRDTAQSIFDRSVRKFRQHFNQTLTVSILKKIKKGEKISKSEESVLIEPRMRAQRIRAVYEFFDERHETPWDFDEFVIKWGKLKDSIHARTDASDYAKDMLRLMKNGALDYLESDFDPATLKDLLEYTNGRLDKMEKWASKDELSLNKYHRLRKGLRSLYFIFKSLKLDAGETDSLVLSIKENEQKMGLIHDRLEEKLMRKEDVPDRLEVPSDVESLIENSQRILLYSVQKGQTCRTAF